jgi:putative lipoprotein (rSAM/lipoprotein system)
MKKKLIKSIILFLGSFFGFLGFGLYCDSNEPEPQPLPYGIPYAQYTLDGTVVDKTSAPSAIKGIQIEWNSHKTISNTNGKWQIISSNDVNNILNYTLIASDIDGTQNDGLFLTTTISGNFITVEPITFSRSTAYNIIIEMSKSN